MCGRHLVPGLGADAGQAAWHLVQLSGRDHPESGPGSVPKPAPAEAGRRRDRPGPGELAECVPGGTDPARVYEQKELAEAIGRFVEALPREEQQAFVCRYWYMASIEEIGRATGFGKSKVKSLLFRSRKRLAARLREEGLC